MYCGKLEPKLGRVDMIWYGSPNTQVQVGGRFPETSKREFFDEI